MPVPSVVRYRWRRRIYNGIVFLFVVIVMLWAIWKEKQPEDLDMKTFERNGEVWVRG